MESVILKVVLVLGIVIAGGFLLFFMADILMAIFNGKKDEKIIEENEKKEVAKVEKNLEDAGVSKEEATALLNGAVVEEYDVNAEEEKPAEEVEETQDEEAQEEDEEESDEDEESEDDRDAYIEARRKALMERLARMNDDDEDEEEASDEDEEVEDEEESDDEETEETEETQEDVVDLDEESEELEDNDTANQELEDARRALEEERAKTEALKAELADARRSVVVPTGEPVYLSEEEYEAKLAVLNERLKLNEKELRACKKEYLPLRRVKKTLENDEKKLRRKEALVAKQKVVLYGVNNYADIDEEKAKKLAEDLDLLDGLKLSVEHCQEVMNKNQERYPLLERIFNVLNEQNEGLKEDIARAEKELSEVRAKKGN